MNSQEAEQRVQEILDATKDWIVPRGEEKIYIIDNGQDYSAHALYFCKTDLELSVLRKVIGTCKGKVIGIADVIFEKIGVMSENGLWKEITFYVPYDKEYLDKSFVDIPIHILWGLFEYKEWIYVVEILEEAYEHQLITRLAGLDK